MGKCTIRVHANAKEVQGALMCVSQLGCGQYAAHVEPVFCLNVHDAKEGHLCFLLGPAEHPVSV